MKKTPGRETAGRAPHWHAPSITRRQHSEVYPPDRRLSIRPLLTLKIEITRPSKTTKRAV